MYGQELRGYGGGGYGRAGRGLGYGPGVGRVAQAPAGYTYMGACRCGHGPRAYYQDASGRVLPASQVFGGAVTPPAATAEQPPAATPPDNPSAHAPEPGKEPPEQT